MFVWALPTQLGWVVCLCCHFKQVLPKSHADNRPDVLAAEVAVLKRAAALDSPHIVQLHGAYEVSILVRVQRVSTGLAGAFQGIPLPPVAAAGRGGLSLAGMLRLDALEC